MVQIKVPNKLVTIIKNFIAVNECQIVKLIDQGQEVKKEPTKESNRGSAHQTTLYNDRRIVILDCEVHCPRRENPRSLVSWPPAESKVTC